MAVRKEKEMQITKDELVRELAEMADWQGIKKKKKFDELPNYTKLRFECEADKFIKALNNIRRRKINGKKTSTTNIPTV